MEIQMIPKPEHLSRVETGPVQFGDDWPGTFIRGDNAAWYAMTLQMILDNHGEQMSPIMEVAALKSLISDLKSSRIYPCDTGNTPKLS